MGSVRHTQPELGKVKLQEKENLLAIRIDLPERTEPVAAEGAKCISMVGCWRV